MKIMGAVVLVLVAVGVWFLGVQDNAKGRDIDVALVAPGDDVSVTGTDPGMARDGRGPVAERLDVTPDIEVSATPSSAQTADAIITGTVVLDASGEPVVGATVIAHVKRDAERTTHRAATDAQGRYVIAAPVVAQWDLEGLEVLAGATWPQHLERTWRVTVAPADEITRDIRLPRTITLAGMVVDLDDIPVAGARVRAWSMDFDRVTQLHSALDAAETETDTAGHFHLDGLGPTFTLTAETAKLVGHITLTSSWPTEHDAIDDLRIVLSPARTIRGRVVDARGTSIADARVEASVDGWSPTPSQSKAEEEGPLPVVSVSAESGRFELERVASRNLDITVDADGFPKWHGTHAPGDPELVVRLETGGTLRGRVVGSDGSPLSGAYVRFNTSPRSSRHSTNTDSDGVFSFRGLAPTDQGFLGVRAEGHAVHVREPLIIEENTPHPPVDIALEPALQLAGAVVDGEGKPIDGAWVSIEGERVLEQFNQTPKVTWESLASDASVSTGADGAFTFDHLYAGPFTITAQHPDDHTLRVQVRAAAGITDQRVVLDHDVVTGVGFSGRVTDALTGAPLPSFSVAVIEGSSGWNRKIESDDGRYMISGYLPGEKSVSFHAEGYAHFGSESDEYDVGVHVVDAVLLPLRELHLRVLDTSGVPVEGAKVGFSSDGKQIMVPGARPFTAVRHLETDHLGEVHATELPAKTIHVEASPGSRIFGEKLEVAERSFDLTAPLTARQDLVLGEADRVELDILVVTRGPAASGEMTWPPASATREDRIADMMAKFESGEIRGSDATSMSVVVRTADGRLITSHSVYRAAVPVTPMGPPAMTSRARVPRERLNVSITIDDETLTQQWSPDPAASDVSPVLVFVIGV